MSVPKINPDLYVGNTGKKLKDFGACAVTYNGDFHINYGNQWSHYKLPFSYEIYNSNSELFQPYDGGIKILKDGYYIISAQVNVDFIENTTGGIVLTQNNTSNEIRTTDFYSTGMTTLLSSPMLLRITAGTTIYCCIRYSNANVSLLSRGLRSQMLIQTA